MSRQNAYVLGRCAGHEDRAFDRTARFAQKTLAGLGADVIKLTARLGDPLRKWRLLKGRHFASGGGSVDCNKRSLLGIFAIRQCQDMYDSLLGTPTYSSKTSKQARLSHGASLAELYAINRALIMHAVLRFSARMDLIGISRIWRDRTRPWADSALTVNRATPGAHRDSRSATRRGLQWRHRRAASPVSPQGKRRVMDRSWMWRCTRLCSTAMEAVAGVQCLWRHSGGSVRRYLD